MLRPTLACHAFIPIHQPVESKNLNPSGQLDPKAQNSV